MNVVYTVGSGNTEVGQTKSIPMGSNGFQWVPMAMEFGIERSGRYDGDGTGKWTYNGKRNKEQQNQREQ